MKKILLIVFMTGYYFFASSQTGRVGINTITPQAMLHVKDSSVVFTGPAGITNGSALPPVSGAGMRMMWYPARAAFRVGEVNGANWDRDSIGSYSIAAGKNTKAKGTFSVALGAEVSALGINSTAIGVFSNAIGDGSIAFGNSTSAIGYTSTTFGYGTFASGFYSTALGYTTIASGAASFAAGGLSVSSGEYATALGFGTSARPYGSLVIGRYNDSVSSSSTTTWTTSDPLFMIGNGTSDVARSNAVTVLKNGNVGIGVVNPLHPLHVSMGAPTGIVAHSKSVIVAEKNNDEAYISIITDSDQASALIFGNELNSSDGGIFYNTSGSSYDLRLRTNGNATRMTIDSIGNVGIGTTSPQYKFHVLNSNAAAGGATEGILVENNSGTTGEAAISFRNAGTNGSGPKQWMIGMDQTRNFSWGYGSQFDAGAFRMLLDSTGKLGVGTSSPDEKIEVVGNIKLSGEVNRTSTGSANLVPICYGYVLADGTIGGGTGNFSVNKTGTGLYEIPITGETYTLAGYVTVVNVINVRSFATVVPFGGKLIINTQNPAGADLNVEFNFVVYKL